MKNCFKYLFTAILGAGLMAACSPEEFEGVNEAGVPSASQYKLNIVVDQETNQVDLSIVDASNNAVKGIYPVLEIEKPDGKIEKSTNPDFSMIFAKAGDYNVTAKVANRNGISDGTLEGTFHLNKSIMDFTKYFTMISKATWHVANKEKGHLACGEPGTDGTNWWSGDPDCKLAEGVYDNVLTFTEDAKYTFDPGEHGTIYVNKGVTIWPDYRNPDEDFNVPAELQTTEFSFDTEGDDLVLVLEKGAYFPYIANDEIWNEPRYKIVNMTTKKMTLLIDNGAISWQYILTTENTVTKVFKGFDYNSPDNLWKQANATFQSLYYAQGGGWAGLPDYEHSEENDVYTVKLTEATDMQWQAQYALGTELNSNIITPGTKYDFSCKVVSNTDLPSFTAKLTSPTDDPSLVNNQGSPAKINAFEDTYIYFTELEAPAFDGNYKFVFDFGGNPANTEVTISDIVIIDHSKNTIVPPTEEEEPEGPAAGQVDWSGANMLAGMPVEITQWYAPGWNQIADAEYTAENGVYTITYPEAASDQWMAQFTFNNTGIALDPEKSYDFRIKITSSNDHPGVTIKLTQQDDDDTYITADRHALVAFEEKWIELSDLKFVVNGPGKGVIDNLKMPFDFGGVEAGTVITMSDMHLQEHKEFAGGSSTNWNGENLLANIAPELTQWYAPGWSPIADAEYTAENGVYNIIYPSATTDQWMAQFTLNNTGIALDPAKTYDLRLKMISSTDHPGATVKFTQQDDDNTFITADRHPLAAYEETWIELTDLKFIVNGEGKGVIDNLKIVFDFGGNAENTEITISDMHLQEHKAGGNSGSGAAPFDYNSDDNLWKSATLSNAGIYYAPNWGQIADFTNEITNQKITVSLPEATFGEWQAQLPVLTNLDKDIISADKKYDFQCKITASLDHPGMTLKLVEDGPNNTPGSLGINYDSNAIFYNPGVVLPAYEEVVVTLTGMQGVALQDNPLKLVLDFGNNAAGTDIEICDIILREAK